MKTKLNTAAKQTVWMKFQCGGGARWTSTTENNAGEVCTFSGCNCGTKVQHAGDTADRNEAADWFRRPAPAAVAENV